MRKPAKLAKASGTLAFRLDRLADRYVAHVESAIAGRDGFEMAQLHVLAAIGENGPVSASEIVAMTGLHKSRVSRAVAAFARLEWVEFLEDESDGRRVALRLSRAGKREFTTLTLLAGETERALVARLGRGRKSVYAALEKLELIAPDSE